MPPSVVDIIFSMSSMPLSAIDSFAGISSIIINHHHHFGRGRTSTHNSLDNVTNITSENMEEGATKCEYKNILDDVSLEKVSST